LWETYFASRHTICKRVSVIDRSAALSFNKKMENVKQKKKKGRPATGLTPFIGLRLAADEIDLVDELAAELGIDRSKALRVLLREGLAARARKKQRVRRAEAKNAEIIAEVLADASEPELGPATAPRRRPGYRGRLTPEEIKAAADRAEQRSRSN
jgi:hypothetical protein